MNLFWAFLFLVGVPTVELPIPDDDLVLGEPVVVSQAPPEVREWGPWQFPHLERLADGRIHIDYHLEADSARSYGKPVGHAYSPDNGRTWKQGPEEEALGGLLLPGGDRLRPFPQESIPSRLLKLPPPLKVFKGSYSVEFAILPVSALPSELSGYRLLRCPKGESQWRPELPRVSIPDETALVTEDVYAFPSFDKAMARWRLAPDGALLAATYSMRRMPNFGPARTDEYKFGVVILRSGDGGRTWTTWSQIPYRPDEAADPSWARRDGFSEPDLCFLADGSVFCLIRTSDGLGAGPLYGVRSADGARTWSAPAVYDQAGVWPVLLTLGSGVTLAAYGRPGLYLRASSDSAKTWGRKSVVVIPREQGGDSCSYSDLLALDDRTALLVYTDFNWPDARGVKRKTVLVRSVRVGR